MSRNELIDAYRRGRISRRTFMKGMTAAGVSAAAAAGIAARLDRTAAAPRGGAGVRPAAYGDVYDDVYPTTAPTAVPTTAPTGGTTTLPSTGSGRAEANSSLWKPVAVAGAAAAFVAAKVRKVRGAETE